MAETEPTTSTRRSATTRRLPGHLLIEGADAGGRRWFLAGRPVHAGTGLELAVVRETRRCACYGDDHRCPECGGSGQVDELDWLPVRLEFDYHEGRALVCIPTLGPELAVTAQLAWRFRWPR